MDNNTPLNVFSNQYRQENNQIDQIANMINTSGANRGQRRRLEKTLAKTTKLSQKAMAKLEDKAYEKYMGIAERDFVHFNAILGLVMYEDYHWKESEDQEHGQILSLMERIQKKMKKYQDMDYTTEDVARELQEKTGITLVTDKDYDRGVTEL